MILLLVEMGSDSMSLLLPPSLLVALSQLQQKVPSSLSGKIVAGGLGSVNSSTSSVGSSSSSLITQQQQHATPIAFAAVAKHNVNLLENGPTSGLTTMPVAMASLIGGTSSTTPASSSASSVASSSSVTSPGGPYSAVAAAPSGSPGGGVVAGGGPVPGQAAPGQTTGLPYSFSIRQIPNNSQSE